MHSHHDIEVVLADLMLSLTKRLASLQFYTPYSMTMQVSECFGEWKLARTMFSKYGVCMRLVRLFLHRSSI